jgi:hypothetical protein
LINNWRVSLEAAKKDSTASRYQGQAGKDYALGRQQDVLHDLRTEIQSRYFTRHLLLLRRPQQHRASDQQ